MKKNLVFFMILCLLLSVLPAAQAGLDLSSVFGELQTDAPGKLSDVFESSAATAPPPDATGQNPALFDSGVREITCAPYGNRVDYAKIEGWAISRGYLFAEEKYCITGLTPDREVVALTDTLPDCFVPAGDAFIYYGMDGQGDFSWVAQRPGETPERLDLDVTDEVFYADADAIWYFSQEDEASPFVIHRLLRNSGNKQDFATVQGIPVVVLETGGVLVANFDAQCLESWQDGEASILYQSAEPFLSVASVGRSVWVGFEEEIALLEDGALSWRVPGDIVNIAASTDQYLFLLASPVSEEYEAILFNDRYRAWARVGRVPATPDALGELEQGWITVWSPIQSLIFEIPPMEEWIPYGYPDVASARAAGNVPSINIPSATVVPMPEQTAQPAIKPATREEPDGFISATLPAYMLTLTGEEEARQEAEALGIRMDINPDGTFTYHMTPAQQEQMLDIRRQEIWGFLEAAVNNEMFNDTIKAYSTNDDFSQIDYTVDAAAMEDSLALVIIMAAALDAPLYQMLEGKGLDAITTIRLIDQASGEVVGTFTGPDDFLHMVAE